METRLIRGYAFFSLVGIGTCLATLDHSIMNLQTSLSCLYFRLYISKWDGFYVMNKIYWSKKALTTSSKHIILSLGRLVDHKKDSTFKLRGNILANNSSLFLIEIASKWYLSKWNLGS